MFRIVFISVFACAVFVGCATPLKSNQVRVMFNSEPPGALIYWKDIAYGTAPQTLTFDLPTDAVRRGYLNDNFVRAIWPSGAEVKGIRLTMQIREGVFKFSRPPNAPGLDKDLAYAAQLRQIQASEEQASAASSAAFWQMYNSTQPRSPTYTDCTKFGSSVSCTTR